MDKKYFTIGVFFMEGDKAIGEEAIVEITTEEELRNFYDDVCNEDYAEDVLFEGHQFKLTDGRIIYGGQIGGVHGDF